MGLRCRLSGAWLDTSAADGRGAGVVTREERARVTPDAFPGRFSPLRGFPEGFEPLPAVAGTALARAGLWTPGSEEPVSGGLVLGLDAVFLEPMRRFASQVRDRFGNDASPMTFVESHPSTAASFLGMLYGLSEYQTAVVRGPLSGFYALSHAVDALRTARLARALVVIASEARGGRTATALCLDATGEDLPGLDVGIGIELKQQGYGKETSDEGVASDVGALWAAVADFGAAPPDAGVFTIAADDGDIHVTLQRL